MVGAGIPAVSGNRIIFALLMFHLLTFHKSLKMAYVAISNIGRQR